MPQYQYLNINISIKAFWSLTEAHVELSDWKHDYNHHRRHSALATHHQRACASYTCAVFGSSCVKSREAH